MVKLRTIAVSYLFFLLVGCGHPPLDNEVNLPSDYTYLIGAGDDVEIFVWDNPDISRNVTVRPDGKINTPLLDDLLASGKTPSELAREIEEGLAKYVRDPLVAVMVNNFQGIYQQQVRVIGQITGGSSGSGSGGSRSGGSSSRGSSSGGSSSGSSAGSNNRFSARSLPYRKEMTLLDLIIEIGGIGEFGDGNRSSIIRRVDGQQKQFGIRIDDLIEDGDLTANIKILPGDIVIVPETFF